jgi:hypothetical protein
LAFEFGIPSAGSTIEQQILVWFIVNISNMLTIRLSLFRKIRYATQGQLTAPILLRILFAAFLGLLALSTHKIGLDATQGLLYGTNFAPLYTQNTSCSSTPAQSTLEDA